LDKEVVMAKVVVTGKIPSGALTRLRAEHDVLAWEETTPISRDELLKRVSGADAIVSLLTEKIDDELLAAAGAQLKSVSNVAVGYNNMAMAAVVKRSVSAPTLQPC
jgi:glyoxylate reductase